MQCLTRDRDQRDDLVRVQMQERRELQKQIEVVRRRHAMNRRLLAREMAHALDRLEQAKTQEAAERTRQTRTRALSR